MKVEENADHLPVLLIFIFSIPVSENGRYLNDQDFDLL